MQYSEALAQRPIWIALSKVDQLEADALDQMLQEFAQTFPDRPIYAVSSLGDIGLPELCNDLMLALQQQQSLLQENSEFAEQQKRLEERISDDVWAHSERMRMRRRGEPSLQTAADVTDDYVDDEGVEVVYVPD